MATLKVGSARIDENGKLHSGKAGDQTKKEVSTQDYYVHSKGWYLLRPKSVEIANALAAAMKRACDNENIGYDQYNRLGIIKYGTYTKTKTECDCSSLVRQCVIEATGKDPGNFTTENEPSKLEATGYFEDRVEVTKDTVLHDGDILVTKKKGHTVIVVSGNPRIEPLKVDGLWGKDTTTVVQTVFKKLGYNVTVDGMVSNQDIDFRDDNPGLLSSTFEWEKNPDKNGSLLIKAIQEFLNETINAGLKVDGYLGPKTIKAMQYWLVTVVDGYVSNPSQMVKAFQRWLNEQI